MTTRGSSAREHVALRRSGRVARTLAREVWARRLVVNAHNVIDTHVARLRKKIDAEHPGKLIHTIRGVGFMMREGEA